MSSIALDLTAEEQALVKRLRSLKVPAMADALEQQLKDPNADLNSFMERISMLVDAECQSRANKRFARLLKKADDRKAEHMPLDRGGQKPARHRSLRKR